MQYKPIEKAANRVAVFNITRTRTVVVVADGAGGTGAGDVAALAVIREIEAEYLNIHSANEWVLFLRQIDCRIGDGETTAVVVDVRTIGIAGASVGDSRAVIVNDGTISELTANQKRKPLIGSGMAEPIGFICPPLDGLLLLGTDMLFSTTRNERDSSFNCKI